MTTLQARLETKLSGGGGIFRNRQGELEDGKTHGITCFLGAVINQLAQTKALDIMPCTYEQVPDGILAEIKGGTVLNANDAQGLMIDNLDIQYGKLMPGDKVLVCAGINRTCVKGHLAIVDKVYPGFVQDMSPDDESVDDVPPFRMVGKFLEAVTGVAAQACYVYIEII